MCLIHLKVSGEFSECRYTSWLGPRQVATYYGDSNAFAREKSSQYVHLYHCWGRGYWLSGQWCHGNAIRLLGNGKSLYMATNSDTARLIVSSDIVPYVNNFLRGFLLSYFRIYFMKTRHRLLSWVIVLNFTITFLDSNQNQEYLFISNRNILFYSNRKTIWE